MGRLQQAAALSKRAGLSLAFPLRREAQRWAEVAASVSGVGPR